MRRSFCRVLDAGRGLVERCDALSSGSFFRPLVSTTDMIATPIDEATCWLMLSSVEPRATSCDFSVFSAEVISGIIVAPMPSPMTNSTGRM